MKKLPVLFQRDQCNETLLVVPRSKENLNKLKVLANKHAFQIGVYGDMFIVDQGEGGWEKVSKKASSFVPAGFHLEKPSKMTMGPETVAYVCNHCPREHSECGGPLATIPHYRSRRENRTSLDALRQAVGRPDECPLYDQNVQDVDGSIQQKDLRALGWDPVSSVRSFVHNDELNEDDYLTLSELVEKGVDLGDMKAVEENASNIDIQSWIHAHDFPTRRRWGVSNRTTLTDLTFDPAVVGANRMSLKVRGAYAQGKKNKLQIYRQENCERCVFECHKPPWNMDNPKPLTEERIMDEFRPDADDRVWMAMFTIMDWKDKFRSEISGRMRDAIGRRPVRLDSGDWGVEIASRRPGYETIARLTVEEYIDHIKARNNYGPDLPSLSEDDEKKLAYAHWALRAIDDLTSFNQASFYGNGRRQDNAILSIEMRRSCDYIEIGSDTQATTWGGMFSRGSTIGVDSRPRFRTGYSFPFANCIWEWFYRAPDACTGEKKK